MGDPRSGPTDRKVQRELDRAVYMTRNLVECFFFRNKDFRHIAMRYEKPVRNLLSAGVQTVMRYMLRQLGKNIIEHTP